MFLTESKHLGFFPFLLGNWQLMFVISHTFNDSLCILGSSRAILDTGETMHAICAAVASLGEKYQPLLHQGEKKDKAYLPIIQLTKEKGN